MTDEPPSPSPRRAIVGLVVMIALIAGVLFIMRELRDASRIQDCVMSGRTNCAPIESGRR